MVISVGGKQLLLVQVQEVMYDQRRYWCFKGKEHSVHTEAIWGDCRKPIWGEAHREWSEVSDSNEPKIVTDSHATGNPILLIIIVIGLLAGAYVKR